MSFLQHLEELRWRLVRCAIVIVLLAIVIWYFQEEIMVNLFLSMKDKDFVTFRLLCQYIGVCVEEIPVKMQSMTVSGQFTYALMMSFLGGAGCMNCAAAQKLPPISSSANRATTAMSRREVLRRRLTN